MKLDDKEIETINQIKSETKKLFSKMHSERNEVYINDIVNEFYKEINRILALYNFI